MSLFQEKIAVRGARMVGWTSVGLLAGWAIFADAGVPWHVRLRLARSHRPCAAVGTPLSALDVFWYSPGNTARHRQVSYEIDGSQARLWMTGWVMFDDSLAAWRRSYELEYQEERGLVVVDCETEIACLPGRGWGPMCL